MSDFENKIQPKLETEQSIKSRLDKVKSDSVKILQEAIKILSEMEKNFWEAIWLSDKHKFDWKLERVKDWSFDIWWTEFERKASELKNKISEITDKIALNDIMLWLFQQPLKIDDSKWEEENEQLINELIKELIRIQEQSKIKVKEDLEDDWEINMDKHIKIDNEYIQKKLNEIHKEFWITINWYKWEYDNIDLAKNLPNLRKALKSLKPEEIKIMQYVEILLNTRWLKWWKENNRRNFFKLDGWFTSEVLINYEDKTKNILSDIRNFLETYPQKLEKKYNETLHDGEEEFKEKTKNRKIRTIQDLLSHTGIKHWILYMGLSNNTTNDNDYDNIFTNIPKINEALDWLTDEEKETLKETYIFLEKSPSSNKWLNRNRINNTPTITIEYNNTTEQIKTTIQDWIKEYNRTLPIFQNSEPDISSFFRDPSLKYYKTIEIPNFQGTKKEYSEFKIWISRNLYFRLEEPTPKNIIKEYNEIIKYRERIRNIPLLKWNVVLVWHNEEVRNNKNKITGKNYTEEEYQQFERILWWPYTLLTNKTEKAIKKQNPKTKLFRIPKVEVKETLDLLKVIDAEYNTHKNIKKAIEETSPPFRYITHTHWSYGISALSKNKKLRVEEIWESIVKRYENFPELKKAKLEERDIFLFNECYDHNFIRDLYTYIRQKTKNKYSLPIVISTSEYGQEMTYHYTLEYGSIFFEKILNKKSWETTTLWDIMDNEFLNDSNTTILIQDDEWNTKQISSNEITENIEYIA